jgi:hypothetical protein
MRRKILIVLAVIVTVVCSVGGWMYYSFSHMSILITPAQTNDIQLAFKGALGEAMFGSRDKQIGPVTRGQGLDALLAPSNAPKGDGLIVDYQKNPAKYKRYAQLFDTAANAKGIGNAIESEHTKYKFPLLSSEMAPNASDRLDAWGHPYCVIALKNGLAIVSGGPDAKSFVCEEQRIGKKELSSATRQIFQDSQGEVIVLVRQADVRDPD